MMTVDPWLIRKSATCPLCKYECRTSSHDLEEGSDGASIAGSRIVPNDRLMEFVMGPQWVAARTQHHHNGTSRIDRVGNFFGRMADRIRGRPPRSIPTTATILPSFNATTTVTRADENGEVPLQLITPRGVAPVAVDASTLVPIPPLVHVGPSRAPFIDPYRV